MSVSAWRSQMRTCGAEAIQGFTGTRSGIAPPSGVDQPDGWVLKRRSGSSSITEHRLAPKFVSQKPGGDSVCAPPKPGPSSASHKNLGLGRKSPWPGEESPTHPQGLDLKQVLAVLS